MGGQAEGSMSTVYNMRISGDFWLTYYNTQTYLLWGLDVLTVQLFHIFKEPHNIIHQIKWDEV